MKDPLMISLAVLTTIFIIIVSLACVEPWSIPSSDVRGRNTRDITKIPGYQCVYTYKAFQPNLDFFKEKVAEITVDVCNKKADKDEKRKRRRDKAKKSNDEKKKRVGRRKKTTGIKKRKNRSKIKSRISRRRNRNKKNRNKKIFRELNVFRKWKSMMNKNDEFMQDPLVLKQ